MGTAFLPDCFHDYTRKVEYVLAAALQVLYYSLALRVDEARAKQVRVWRNWQTRTVQVHVSFGS